VTAPPARAFPGEGDGAMSRDDAARIWSAAIAAVDPGRLVATRLTCGVDGIACDGRPLDPPACPGRSGRVAVLGAGKAAAGLAAGVAALFERCERRGERSGPTQVVGLVSVPEGCGRVLAGIEVRETRPAGANLPTPAVVDATRGMLALAGGLGPADLAVAVITGGGSALLAAPPEGVPLEEKIAVARFLSEAGADIDELNAVRRAASRVKAGGLARACGAGRLLVLVLSDVIGDPLETIASGPCMPGGDDPRRALDILGRFGAVAAGVAPRLVRWIAARAAAVAGPPPPSSDGGTWTTPTGCRVSHVLLGTNATAVAAAAREAVTLGYRLEPADPDLGAPGSADEVGRRLAAAAAASSRRAAADGVPRAIVAGGEATVRVPADHGRGGRNQQTVLAAVAAAAATGGWPPGAVVASIGTDGEDGPTDAAGGVADARSAAAVARDPARLRAALLRCDAHPLLDACGGLVRTGPTGTNVADVRIVLAAP